jgi:hypothetical protein
MISRRSLIKASLLATGSIPFFHHKTVNAKGLLNEVPTFPTLPQGRIISTATLYTAPKRTAKQIKPLVRDSLIAILDTVEGDRLIPSTNTWYRTENGYVYSAGVQPVDTEIQTPITADEVKEKFWGEICMPFADAYLSITPNSPPFRRLYHGCVFRVVDLQQSTDGKWWYRIEDGVNGKYGFVSNLMINASHIKRLTPEDLAPITPEVENKRIQVNLKTNTITAYENDEPVLTTRCSSGMLKSNTVTPSGKMSVLYKMHTSHMRDRARTYDLPGVAFPTYFTWWGHAIHGTYWHNDYGTYRSHGCLNVPNHIAKWFWRWTNPNAPYESNFYSVTMAKTNGTQVTINWG